MSATQLIPFPAAGATNYSVGDNPKFPGCYAFTMHTQSMAPLIPAGSTLYAIEDTGWREIIEYGQIYCIVMRGGRCMLKRVRKGNLMGYLKLESENPDFDAMHVPEDRIEHMWLIQGWVSRY